MIRRKQRCFQATGDWQRGRASQPAVILSMATGRQGPQWRGQWAGLGDRMDRVAGEACAGYEDSREECSWGRNSEQSWEVGVLPTIVHFLKVHKKIILK